MCLNGVDQRLGSRVASVAWPGANRTGLMLYEEGITGKDWRCLRRLRRTSSAATQQGRRSSGRGNNPFSLGRCIQPSHGCFLVPVREGLMVPDIRGRVAIVCVVSVFLCVRALAQEAYYGGWPRSVAHGVLLKAQQKRRRRHLL